MERRNEPVDNLSKSWPADQWRWSQERRKARTTDTIPGRLARIRPCSVNNIGYTKIYENNAHFNVPVEKQNGAINQYGKVCLTSNEV